MECVIDTNVLVYDMMEDSELHAKAKEALDRTDIHMIPVTVVEEFVHVLGDLKVDRSIIGRKLREILHSETIISMDEIKVKEAIEILEKEKISYKRFNDKLILAAAKMLGAPLLTFDAELVKECKANGVKTVE